MGNLVAWIGLTMIVAVPLIVSIPAAAIAGAVLMIVGVVMMCVGK